jgi:hypothetical protein
MQWTLQCACGRVLNLLIKSPVDDVRAMDAVAGWTRDERVCADRDASLCGVVEDPQGLNCPGVDPAKNVGGNVMLTQVTNETGVYNVSVLRPAAYEISAELPGFKKGVHYREAVGISCSFQRAEEQAGR